MNRRSVVSLAGVAAIGIAAPFALNQSSGNAQDTTDSRLNALETRVSTLETRVAGEIPSLAATPHVVNDDSLSSHLTFTGSGQMLSELFHLDAARYFVSLRLIGSKYDFASVGLLRVGKNTQTPILDELSQAPFMGHVVIQVPEAGDYRLISSADGHATWTMTFTLDA